MTTPAPTIELGKAPDGSIVIRTTIHISPDLAAKLGKSLTELGAPGIIVPTLQIVPPTAS